MIPTIWAEKYKPKTLDDLVLSPENRAYFTNLKADVPHCLFIGSPGIGKTSAARIIVQDILKCNYIYINASDENGIDTIRTRVTSFAQTKSMDGGIKVVILDEADGLSGESLKALRNTIEEYQNHTRFILTANYKHKIITAIHSRCQSFDMTPPIMGVLSRAMDVLQKENIIVSDEQKKLLARYVKNQWPDLRRILNGLQRYSISGTLNLSGEIGDNDLLETIWDNLAEKKALDLRKILIQSETRFQGDYGSLLRQLLNFIYHSNKVSTNIKPELISTICEHLYKDTFVADKEINSFACMLALQRLT